MYFWNITCVWIDLIFTSQPNLITESGVQIVYAKLNLQLYFPPPYLTGKVPF